MKRLLCALMALLLLSSCALASVRVGFEDGFTLELPDGWLHYSLTPEMSQQGVLYCLSDAEAARFLYIQLWNSECEDLDELNSLIAEIARPDSSGMYSFGGTDFIVYDLPEGDVSCCAALLGNKVYNFVFTPQSDSAFMVTAAQIMSSFEVMQE
ncbi:MAG: hypothetical protein IJ466_05085 [Clostridia bacterium]|nr:hypothetical protein [Clostridia bacterium]